MLRIRDKLAILAVTGLVLFSFYSAFSYYPPAYYVKKFRETGSLPETAEVRLLRQLGCVRAGLDPGETVGFFTLYKGDEFDHYYRLAQFGLAPVVVDDSLAHRLLVGYFPRSSAWQTTGLDLALVKECPAGLLLLEYQGQP